MREKSEYLFLYESAYANQWLCKNVLTVYVKFCLSVRLQFNYPLNFSPAKYRLLTFAHPS